MAEETLDVTQQEQDPILSVDAFATKLKTKYPEYKDIDNKELVSKMLSKYPQYSSRVSMGDDIAKKPLATASSNGGQPSKSGSATSPAFPTSTNPSQKQAKNDFYNPLPTTEAPIITQAKEQAIQQSKVQEERSKRAIDYQTMLSNYGKKQSTSNTVARDATGITPQILVGGEKIRQQQEQADKETEKFEAPYRKQGFWGGVKLGAQYASSKLTQGGADLVTGVVSAGDLVARKAHDLDNAIQGKNDPLPNEYAVRDFVDNLNEKARLGLPESYEPDKVTGAIGGLLRLAPSLIGGASTKGMTYYLNGLGTAQQEINKLKNQGVKFNNGSDDLFTQINGFTNLALMHMLNAHVILGKIGTEAESNVISKVALEAMKDITSSSESLTSEGIVNKVKERAIQFTTDLFKNPTKILKAYAATGADLSGFNFADALNKKLSNKVSGTENFKNIDENLEEGLKKALTVDAPMFAIGGHIAQSTGALYGRSPIKYEVVDKLRESGNSPEAINGIKQEISDHGQSEGWSEDEINNSIAHVDRIADAVSKVPSDLTPNKHRKAVDLVLGRNELSEQLQAQQEAKNGFDESIKEIPTKQEEYLTNKIEQANEKLQSIVGGIRISYGKDKETGKFYKTTNGKVEEITKERYDLERLERDARQQAKAEDTNEQGTNDTQPAVQPQQAEVQEQSAVPTPVGQAPVEANTEQPQVAPAIKNANTEALSERTGITLEDTAKEKRGKDVVDKEAQEAIDNDYDAPDLVHRILNEKHQASDTEVGILSKYVDATEKHINDIEKRFEKDASTMSKAEFDDLVDQQTKALSRLQDVAQAARKTGTETARALSARRFEMRSDYSLANMIARKRQANGGERLSTEQLTDVNNRFKQLEEAGKAYEAKIKELETKVNELKASQNVRQSAAERTKRKSVNKAELKEERSKIITDFRAELAKIRKTTSAVAVPYARELAAAVPFVAKMVKNLTVEGIVEIGSVIDHVHEEFKDYIEGLTKNDVRDIIAGVHNEAKPLRNELENQVRSLKSQALLLKKIEDAENGLKRDKNPSKAKNDAVEALKKQLRELEKQNDIPKEEKDLLSYKKRINERIAEVKKRIVDKDYSKPEKYETKLDEEAKRLRREYAKLKQQFDVDVIRDELAKRNTATRIWDVVKGGGGVFRAIQSTLDFSSAVLRQGLFATLRHPVIASKAYAEMWRFVFSENKYNDWLLDLKETPQFEQMKEAGLYISDKNSPEALAREEDFENNIVEKLPIIGKGFKLKELPFIGGRIEGTRTGEIKIGEIKIPGLKWNDGKIGNLGLISAAERAYSGYINVLRVGLYGDMAKVLEVQGKTFESHPKEYQDLSKAINTLTGRGTIPKTLEQANELLSFAFYSPRFIASRLNVLNYKYYKNLSPTARNLVLKDVGITLAGLSALTIAAQQSGLVQVSYNPTSSDFMKWKIGNIRIDIFGGMQQYFVYASQMYKGGRTPARGGFIKFNDPHTFKGDTYASRTWDFVRGKLAPIPSMGLSLASGKDAIGNPYDINSVTDNLVPLGTADTKKIFDDSGILKAIATFPFTQSGVGVSVYDSTKKRASSGGSSFVYTR